MECSRYQNYCGLVLSHSGGGLLAEGRGVALRKVCVWLQLNGKCKVRNLFNQYNKSSHSQIGNIETTKSDLREESVDSMTYCMIDQMLPYADESDCDSSLKSDACTRF